MYIYICNIYMSICMSINGHKLYISVYISSYNCVSNKNQSKKSFKKNKKKTIATLNNIQGQLKHPNKNFVD